MPALIVDPALQASVIRQFNLKGELAPFNLTENVVPIFDIGRLLTSINPTVVTTLLGSQGVRVGTAAGSTYVQTSTPLVNDNNVTDGGFQVNPGAAAVVVDTGALSAGTREITAYLNGSALFDVIVEWRDAANAATLASWSLLVGGAGVGNHVQFGPVNLNFLASERVRIVTGGAVVGTLSSAIHQTTTAQSVAS